MAKPKVGRPPLFRPETMFAVCAANATAKLQSDSERRAIINRIIDNGGRVSLFELNEHFGFDTTPYVNALQKAGWLEIVE